MVKSAVWIYKYFMLSTAIPHFPFRHEEARQILYRLRGKAYSEDDVRGEFESIVKRKMSLEVPKERVQSSVRVT